VRPQSLADLVLRLAQLRARGVGVGIGLEPLRRARQVGELGDDLRVGFAVRVGNGGARAAASA
jgi:hypothetical protein